MKISILIALLICVGFAGFHWLKSPEPADGGGATAGPENQTAETNERDSRDLAREMISAAVESRAARGTGGEPNDAARRTSLKLLAEFSELDGTEAESVLDEVKSATGIPDDVRRGLLGQLLVTLAQRDPAVSLKLLDELGDDAVGSEMAEAIVLRGAATLARSDPAAAAKWIAAREAAGKGVPDYLRREIVAGMAAADPAVAFRFVAGGGAPDRDIFRIGSTAKSDESRTAGLAAMREHLASASGDGADKLMRKYFGGLAVGLAASETEAAIEWIDGAGLSDAEKDAAIDGLLSDEVMISSSLREPEKWIDWMRESLPEEQVAAKLQRLVPWWTKNDYNAVANWLNDQPAGLVRDSATLSFATTLSQHEPEAAATWALTLPDNPDRQNLLQRIYRSWRERDPGAAGEFARGQGISE